MKDLKSRILAEIEIDRTHWHKIARERWLNPDAVFEATEQQSERLKPLITALAELAESVQLFREYCDDAFAPYPMKQSELALKQLEDVLNGGGK